jgi:hypothetical protein
VKHYTSSDFWEAYQKLSAETQELADKNFELLNHPSLHLKRIEELWSVRVGRQYRALGIDVPDGIQWIWIGSHAEYNKLIA